MSGFIYARSCSGGCQAPEKSSPAESVAHGRDYTTTMSLKSAAFFALVTMILLTVLLLADFINNVLAVLNGLIPAMVVMRSLIYMLAGVGLTVFLWVFHRSQS